MKTRVALVALLAIAVAVACTAEFAPNFDGTPTPTGTRTPPPTPVPTDWTISTIGLALNTCHRVASADGFTVRVLNASPAVFTTGTRILLHQVRDDAFAMDATEPPPSLDLDATQAGRYQLDYVHSVSTSADVLLLDVGADATGYGSVQFNRNAQVCTVPVFKNLVTTTNSSVVAQQWNGSRGGVVVFEVLERFTHRGVLGAFGAGLDGGSPNTDLPSPLNEVDCSAPDAVESSGRFALRGGGVGQRLGDNGLAGRARIANAGGGGGCRESGGGGGGNGGAGGRGGSQSIKADGASTTVTTWGVGGAALAASSPRLLFGGGGGGGHNNDSGAVGLGARGGGAILVVGSHLDGSPDGIFLVGGDSAATVDSTNDCDGGGGGGAGGSVLLQMKSPSKVFVSYAFGGIGAFITGTGIAIDDRCGPGGGGGGGQIHLHNASIFAASVEPGRPGEASGDPRDAAPGLVGVIQTHGAPFVRGAD